MRKRFLTLFVFFVFLFGVWGIQVQTIDATQAHRAVQKQFAQKVEQQVLDEISSKGKTTFWVILREKADLSSAHLIKRDRERGEFVYQTLRSVADKSQAGLREFLAQAGVKYTPFWIVNSIEVRDGSANLVNAIASRPEVAQIIADRVIPLPKPTPGVRERIPGTTEWGLDNIKAPQVWSNFNVRGEGIVVANVDTGFQYNHPALVAKYRGNLGGGNFDHNYNWFDPSNVCGNPSNIPCDNNSHGTHTMGTMVGDDGDPGTNQIGVAPHAQFMGCKGCETNSCSFNALNTCGQFILAPTDLSGNNPDVTKRPHIVNNSWGGGPGDPFYQGTVDAWEASGIFPQFSIGNSGPSCGSGGSPGDYINSYAAGAYDINNNIASFSGRGPSPFGGETKPNIAAPGVNVRSSVSIPPDSYANFNGTSMASPHVAGTVALMWSAAPALVRDIAATRAILDNSATDVNDTSCGGNADDNNVWGEGRLDALEAVTQSPICNLGTLNGTVTDSGTLQPIAGALVEAVGQITRSDTTDTNGNYSMDLCEGSFDVTASAFSYTPETVTVNITAGQTTTQDFQLDQAPLANVTGTVTDGSGHGWPLYARIDIDGYPGSPIFTNPGNGVYSVDLPQGTIFTFHVNAVSPGYIEEQRDVDPGANPTEDFALLVDLVSCSAPGYQGTLWTNVWRKQGADYPGPAHETVDITGLAAGQPEVLLRFHFYNADFEFWWEVDNVAITGDNSGTFLENFDGGSLPPGWTVLHNATDPDMQWVFNDPAGRGNLTGGSGLFAIVDSDFFGCCGDQEDTEMRTPVLNFGGDNTVMLDFDTDFNWYDFGLDEIVDVDVGVGSCNPVPGGLVVGNVYDLNTGLPLNGAKVTSDDAPSDFATTGPTPADPGVDDGFYILFSTLTGLHDFTASKNQYGSDTQQVDVVADNVVVQNFSLGTGHLVATPPELEATVDLGNQVTQQLTITNDGTADATFELQEFNGLSSLKIRFKNPDLPKAKKLKNKATGMKSGPASALSMKNEPISKTKGLFPRNAPNGTAWTPASPIPAGTIRYAHAQCDETPESFYVISGVDASFSLTDDVWRYDADTDTWNALAPIPAASEAPTAVCFSGRIYVAVGAFTSNQFLIYDIGTDTWLTGATLPRFVEGGAMGALDGKVYLIGGDDDFFPGSGVSNEVDIYDIATDTWTGTGTPMPTAASNAGHVQSTPFIYIVGGWGIASPGSNVNQTQRYDMSSDTWEVGPTFDVAVSDHAISGTDTALYAMGGDQNGGGFFEATNTAQRLDLGSWPGGAWADLGDPLPEARQANQAGFCTTSVSGGEVWTTGGLNPSFVVHGKNEYFTTGEGCAGAGIDVPWISENPVSATVPANGGQVIVDVTFDAAQVNQPGDYFAHLRVKTDTPYPAQKVNVTMHVPLPANFGILNGTVNGLGHCDGPGAPLEGATVFIDGQLEDFTVTTDANGFYQWALDAANSPVTLTVSANGYVQQVRTGVIITPQQTTTENFDLRLDAACLTVNPDTLEATVDLGSQLTQQFTITNTGAADANFELSEGNGLSSFRRPNLPKAVSKPNSKHGKPGPMSVMTMKNAPASKKETLFPNIPNTWNPAAPIPEGLIRYGHAQCDESPESFYIISGVNSGFGLSNNVYRYDAETDTWTQLASIPSASEAPSAVCFESRIYVAIGAGTSNEFQIYDIATDTWLSGATLPRFVEGAAMGALDGKIYMIGGDDDFFPGSGISNEVNIYDIASDSWTGNGTDMPTAASNAGFVQAGEFIYVVGGWGLASPGTNVDQTQRYDMSGNTWEVGPTFDVAVSDHALSGTDTALYVMGGDANGGGFFEGTTTAQRLDLGSWPGGAWADLGDPLPTARQANQAGFCTTAISGGEVWSTGGFFNFNTPMTENLYRTTGEGCAGAADVPWLSENPFEGVIPKDGGQQVIDVTYDAAQVQQPGDYFAHITVRGNAPGSSPKVNVTMHVPVPPNFGLLNGTVTGLGQCDVPGGPINNATVFVDGPLADYTLETDANGYYQWYFDAANSPVDITVSAPGFIGMTQTGVVMNAGQTTTVDFSLRLDAPCLSVAPTSLDVTLDLGQQTTQQITIMNTGAGDANYKIREANPLALRIPNLPKAVSKADKKRMAMSGPTSARTMKNAPKEKIKALFPATNTPQAWIPGAPIPAGTIRYAHAQCEDNPESFYVISGVNASFSLTNAVWRYDATTDSWTSLAPIPSASEAPTGVCFEGKIYVAVGAFTSNEFFVYDTATDSWSSAASLPRFVEGGHMGALDGKIYLIGGDDDFFPGSGVSNEVNIYDIATNSWTGTGTPMPTAASNAGYVQAGEFVYVVGGWGISSPGSNVNQTQRYDMAGNAWEVGPTFDVAVSDHALSGTDTALYAMGGDQNGGGFFEATNTAQRLDLSSWPGGAWADLGDPLPEARQANQAGFCTTAFTGGEVWTTGGLNPSFVVHGKNEYRSTGEGCAGTVDFPWLSENPAEGVVPAGGQVVVDVLFDASQVPDVGDYFAQLKISGNAPGATPVVDVAMHVINGCTYSNDFNDGILEWIEVKPTVTEPGDGFLHLDPLKRKAIAVADAAFGAQAIGTYTYTIQFTGGPDAKNWLYITREDKKHQVEVLFKFAQGKLVVKDRNFSVQAKAKADFTFAADTPYVVTINYDGTNIDVSIDGTPVITDFVPSRSLPSANTGAAAKANSLLIDNFCFQ